MMKTLTLACVIGLLTGCQSSSSSKEQNVASGTFDVRHEFTIEVPAGCSSLQAWLPMPLDDDAAQDVQSWNIECAYPTQVVRDARGNRFLLVSVSNPAAGVIPVTTTFRLKRWEVQKGTDPALTRPLNAAELLEHHADLVGSSQSVIDDDSRAMAARIVGGERNPLRAGRLIYDAILDHVEYHVKDPKPDSEKTLQASGTGSSRYTMEKCTGNCTDFHSLYAALARASGIPTRAIYGSFLKGPLDGVNKDQSYHCWLEIFAPNVGWVPLDVAVADVFVADFHANEYSQPRADLTVANGYHGPDAHLVNYYYGNIEERRVVWHRGRDLVMIPPQKGAPLLWNPKGYAEADGVAVKVGRLLTFHSVK